MKNCNRCILSFLIGGILFSGIAVTAITLTTKEVTYSPKNQNFKVNNTDDALNYLYKLTDYEVPANTYFYDNTTSGENIKRYKKVNNKYYECDQYGNVSSGSKEVSVNSGNLVEYKGTNAGNLTAGSAGYANKNFVLGDGTDSIKNSKSEYPIFLGTYSNDGTFNIKEKFSDYQELTADNFIVEVTSTSSLSSNNGWAWGGHISTNIIKNYNPKTGVLNVNGSVFNWNGDMTIGYSINSSGNVYRVK